MYRAALYARFSSDSQRQAAIEAMDEAAGHEDFDGLLCAIGVGRRMRDANV